MSHPFMGPLWGNVLIVTVAGAITLACFGVMLRMLFHPGERDPQHPKYMVLREDQRDDHPEGG